MPAKIVCIDPDNIDQHAIDEAAEAAKHGAVMVFPTETVYGLGCSINSEQARERIYRIKQRRGEQPLAICVHSVDAMQQFEPKLSEISRQIMETFLPGPLTVILRCKNGEKIGFRVPDFEVTQRLLVAAGPMYATSVNVSGEAELIAAEDILAKFGEQIDLLLDAGPSRLGLPSTVLDLSEEGPTLVREGAISAKEIEAAIGIRLRKKTTDN